jgi:uncharacterized protein (TIGR03086 family)
MSDVIERYLGLAEQFGARVEATPDDQWSAQSPCPDWKARDIVAHVVGSQRALTGAIEGTPVEAVPDDADPKALWRASMPKLVAALQTPGALEKQVAGPMGDMPIEFMLGRFLSNDVLVHTWDLARAVGGDERLDQDAVGHAFEGLKPVDAMLRRPGVFGDKVEPPEGADLQTSFLCFLGRRP